MSLLQPLNIEIQHIAGKSNAADPLSRRPDHLQLATLSSLATSTAQAFAAAYQQDPAFSPTQLQTRPTIVFRDPYFVDATTDRIQVPDSSQLRQSLLLQAHNSVLTGHFGQEKTQELLQRTFHWHGLARDVASYIKSCDSCQRCKPSTRAPGGLLQPSPIPDEPWQSVGLDLITDLPKTPRGFTAILVVVDRLTKLAHFQPTVTTCSAPDLAQLFIDTVVRHHGIPQTLISDRDPRFTSRFWKAVFASLGTTLSFSTTYHPQTDGQTERTNRTLKQQLKVHVDSWQTNWDNLLAPLEFAYNNSCHSSTHQSPFQLTYGYSPALPLTLGLSSSLPAAFGFISTLQQGLATAKTALAKAQVHMKTQADKHRRPVVYSLGDQVLLSSKTLHLAGLHQLSPPFIGPFPIIQVISPLTYRLLLPSHFQIHNVFHVDLLKPYNFPLPGQQSAIPPAPLVADTEPEWEVEALLQAKGPSTSRRSFLLSWKGFPAYENSYVSRAELLRNCSSLVHSFEHQHGLA